MKILQKITVLLLFTFVLTGCEFTDIFKPQPCTPDECAIVETEEITNLINVTSEAIRLSNIHIKKTVYEKNALGGPKLYSASSAEGSGFVFKEDADYYYALTNFHVIDIEISPTRLYSVEYEVIINYVQIKAGVSVIAQGDANTDLAVIRFPKNSVTVPLMDLSERATTGAIANEFILIVGNPGGQINVVSTSKVILICQCLSGIDFNVIYFQFNMQSPGNSGGAVTDIHGNVLGIITWQNPDDFRRKFAIPLKVILDFLETNEITLE